MSDKNPKRGVYIRLPNVLHGKLLFVAQFGPTKRSMTKVIIDACEKYVDQIIGDDPHFEAAVQAVIEGLDEREEVMANVSNGEQEVYMPEELARPDTQ